MALTTNRVIRWGRRCSANLRKMGVKVQRLVRWTEFLLRIGWSGRFHVSDIMTLISSDKAVWGPLGHPSWQPKILAVRKNQSQRKCWGNSSSTLKQSDSKRGRQHLMITFPVITETKQQNKLRAKFRELRRSYHTEHVHFWVSDSNVYTRQKLKHHSSQLRFECTFQNAEEISWL